VIFTGNHLTKDLQGVSFHLNRQRMPTDNAFNQRIKQVLLPLERYKENITGGIYMSPADRICRRCNNRIYNAHL